MHILTVAKVKDYPDIEQLLSDLTWYDDNYYIDDTCDDTKSTAHFDYCTLGGRFSLDGNIHIATYKQVIEKHGRVNAYLLENYEFFYTEYDDNKCPFKSDDVVYIIDGHQ